jgi:hypothetical protein
MKGTMSFSARVGLFLAAIGLAIITTSASAVQYTYTFEGETGGGLLMGIQTSGGGADDLVGQFIMTTSSPGGQSPLYTYCTDVGADLATIHNYTPMSLSSAASVGGVDPTWISGGIQNAAALWYANAASAVTVDQQAGLQLAIWEALYNNQATYTSASFFDSSNGGFYITSPDTGNIGAAASYAATLLNSDPSAAPDVTWLAPVYPDGSIGGSQGLLCASPTSVPEATSTLMLLGAALTALGFAGRKLRAK